VRAPRTDWKLVWLKLAGAAVPILTLGAGSPVMMGVLAFRRRRFWLRSLLLWASVGVYLGIAVPFWVFDWGDEQKADSTQGDVLMACQLALIAVASVQAAIVIGSPRKYAGRPVDLNEASAYVLATLPGLTPQVAANIVTSRQLTGRFRHVDELWSRGLLRARRVTNSATG
jgi:hypothetical protein